MNWWKPLLYVAGDVIETKQTTFTLMTFKHISVLKSNPPLFGWPVCHFMLNLTCLPELTQNLKPNELWSSQRSLDFQASLEHLLICSIRSTRVFFRLLSLIKLRGLPITNGFKYISFHWYFFLCWHIFHSTVSQSFYGLIQLIFDLLFVIINI